MTILGRLRPARLLPYAAAALFVALAAFDPGQIMAGLRSQVFDQYQRIKPRVYADPATLGMPGVRYVDIDDESLTELGQWPWPRTLIARMVERLAEAGAAVVAFDMVFAEPDRSSPDQLAKSWPADGPYDSARKVLALLPANDAILASAMQRMPVVLGVIFGDANAAELPKPKTGMAVAGALKPADFVPRFLGAVRNLPELEGPAKGLGALNVVPDFDGVIRQTPLLVSAGGAVYPSAIVEVLRLARRPNAIAVKTAGASGETDFGAATGIVAIKAGSFVIPTTGNGSLALYFTGHTPSRKLRAADIIAGRFDPALVKGAIVWVGTSAAGLKDLRTTPLERAAPGVEIQVEATEQAMLGATLLRPDFAPGAELALAALLGLIVAFLSLRISAYWMGGFAIVAAGTAIFVSWYAFDQWRWLLDPVGPALTALAAFMTGSLVRFAETEGERAYVRQAFTQYLQEDVVSELSADPDKLKLGGETRTMTFLFCDVRGFTSIAESYRDDPKQLTALINRLLTPLTKAVMTRRGTIDKYMGDCVMAFWNAPLNDPDHAAHAAQAALDMVHAMEVLNGELSLEAQAEGRPFKPIKVGIGINTGPAVVGNMGSDIRFDYSVLGDAVNLAARIQTYSGNYGVDIAIGEDTQAQIGSRFATLKVDRIAVKGKDRATDVFALLGQSHIVRQHSFGMLRAQHAHFFEAISAKRWVDAEAALKKLENESPLGTALYETHLERVEQLKADPPPDPWDGGWKSKVK